MKIHTFHTGETVSSIAKEYGVLAEKILLQNGIADSEELTEGDELVVTEPTRTTTVRKGDAPERIARRYGITAESLERRNLFEIGRGIMPGEVLTLKGEAPILGQAAIIGSTERTDVWKPAFSLLDAVTMQNTERAGARCSRKKESGFRKNKPFFLERKMTEADMKNGVQEICAEVEKNGMNGIVITLPGQNEIGYLALCRFLLALKKALLKDGKILLCKTDAEGRILPGELADGWIYPSSILTQEPECLALLRCGTVGTSLLDFSREGECGKHRGLKKIKAEFEKMTELGFMGIYLDTERESEPFLTMLATLLAPVNYALFLTSSDD